MPAKKPSDLVVRHETKEEIARREQAEEALTPTRDLPVKAPASISSDPVASSHWRRLRRLFSSVKAEIVTALDFDLMVDYCLAMSQLADLDDMRSAAHSAWRTMDKTFKELPDDCDVELRADIFSKLLKAQNQLRVIDARCDSKRKFLLLLRQSLYMTPRARAGTAPEEKDKTSKNKTVDPMEALLNRVSRNEE